MNVTPLSSLSGQGVFCAPKLPGIFSLVYYIKISIAISKPTNYNVYNIKLEERHHHD